MRARIVLRNAWTQFKREQDIKQSCFVLAVLAVSGFLAQHKITHRVLQRLRASKLYKNLPDTYSLVTKYGKAGCITLLFPVLLCFVHSALQYKPPTDAEREAVRKISYNRRQDLHSYLKGACEQNALFLLDFW